MSLAQVVYNISSDSSFADQWQKDPTAALRGRGLNISREEIAFLSTGLKQAGYDNKRKFNLLDLEPTYGSWRE